MRLALAVFPPGVEIFLAGALGHLELFEQHRGVGVFEIVPRIFLLGLQEHVAIGDLVVTVAAVEVEIVDVIDALHIHRETLKAVGQFASNRRAFDASDLLEISELRNFHAVTPAFPAEAPRPERRALPVVLDKADVMQRRVDADGLERLQIQILNVRRRRLQDHLELIVVLQAVRILAIAAILRAARRLHISRIPALRAERAKRRRRMERTRADFHVVGLQDDAAMVGPIALQRQDQALKRTLGTHVRRQGIHRKSLTVWKG